MTAPRAVLSGPAAWLAPAALSVTLHLAALGGVVGLGGLVRPPAPVALVPVELSFEAAPVAAPAPPPVPALAAPAAAAPPRPAPDKSVAKLSPPPEPEPVAAEPPPAPQADTPESVAPVDPTPPSAQRAALPPPPPLPRVKPTPPPPRAKPAMPEDAAPVVRSLAEGAATKAPPPAPDDAPAPQSASLPSDAAPAAVDDTAPAPPKITAPGFGHAALGNPPPRYPDSARRRGQQGNVLLRVHVESDGTAEKVEVLDSSGHRLLDEAARRAVARWRFTPATLAGVAISGTVDIPVTFRLKD